MPKTFVTTTRSLLLAGALAFAALPVLAQTAPSTQPAAPTASSTVTPDSTPTGKSTTGTSKSQLRGKKIAAAHSKSKIHTVSAKKSVSGKTQKPETGATSGSGTADTTNTKKP